MFVSARANPRYIYPVGFSLGGQVVGHVGRNVRRLIGIQLSAILSLDPAGPGFNYDSWTSRVNTDDAEHVEVVHTNGGTLAMHEVLGHIDFYVHGGKTQNGCGIDLFGGCSHTRAVEYWIESIRGGTFLATRCANYENVTKSGCSFLSETKIMFEEPIRRASGIFWVDTNKSSPYALN